MTGKRHLEAFGEYLVARRVAAGHRNRAAWAREIGLPNDRILNDLENGKRNNYNDATLAGVDHWYGLTPGTALAVVREGASWDHPDGGPSVSVPSHTVTVTEEGIGERAGRSIITVRADAIGVTLTIDYDGPDDRRRALAEAMWALGIERGRDDGDGVLHTKGGDK